jgi:hypothetical protein
MTVTIIVLPSLLLPGPGRSPSPARLPVGPLRGHPGITPRSRGFSSGSPARPASSRAPPLLFWLLPASALLREGHVLLSTWRRCCHSAAALASCCLRRPQRLLERGCLRVLPWAFCCRSASGPRQDARATDRRTLPRPLGGVVGSQGSLGKAAHGSFGLGHLLAWVIPAVPLASLLRQVPGPGCQIFFRLGLTCGCKTPRAKEEGGGQGDGPGSSPFRDLDLSFRGLALQLRPGRPNLAVAGVPARPG